MWGVDWERGGIANRQARGAMVAPRAEVVEVGGVEPPSEDLSVQASTCVAGVCISPPDNPADRAPDSQPIGFRPAGPGPGPSGLARLYDALIPPGERGREDVAAS